MEIKHCLNQENSTTTEATVPHVERDLSTHMARRGSTHPQTLVQSLQAPAFVPQNCPSFPFLFRALSVSCLNANAVFWVDKHYDSHELESGLNQRN